MTQPPNKTGAGRGDNAGAGPSGNLRDRRADSSGDVGDGRGGVGGAAEGELTDASNDASSHAGRGGRGATGRVSAARAQRRDPLDVEATERDEGPATRASEATPARRTASAPRSEDSDLAAHQDAALAEVAPASDSEIDVIESGWLPAVAPRESRELALRDPLREYFAEVRRYPLLTREQEQALAVRWVRDGDQEAARALVTSNLRLVIKIANEYRRAYNNLLDLVQEGNLGLLKAVQKYDPDRGTKLSTYAAWWIRAYILKYLLNSARLVKLGTTQNQRKLFFNLRKQQAALRAAGVDPSPERIADALGVTPKEVVEMERRLSGPDQSLNAPLHADGDGTATRMDALEAPPEDPAAAIDTRELRELLHDALAEFSAGLQGRDAQVFAQRLVAEEPKTLQELGDEWGVTRERARQIEARIVKKLREFLRERLGDAVDVGLEDL